MLLIKLLRLLIISGVRPAVPGKILTSRIIKVVLGLVDHRLGVKEQ